MTIPEGLAVYTETKYSEEECLVLDKSIHGLVQAARQFHKKFIEIFIKNMNFEKCAGDEYLLMCKDSVGIVMICVYIDSTLCAGDRRSLGAFKNE